MKRFNALLAAALIGLSLDAAAHEGEPRGKKTAAVVKDQKGWGIAGDARAVARTIHIVMTDGMRFTPERLEVRQGETVRFVHRNAGKMMHEFVLGTQSTNEEHAALMLRFPDMEHDEPYMAHVGPGKTGEMIWTFNRAGEFEFACLIAGHYQAGMVGRVKVVPSGEGLAKDQKAASPPARGG